MNIKQVLQIFILILIISSYIGCIESNENVNNNNFDSNDYSEITFLNDGTKIIGDINKIKIISYNVTTKVYNLSTHSYFNKSGFYHNNSLNEELDEFIIFGTAKNIAGREFKLITIYAHFYDKNDIFLNLTAGSWNWDVNKDDIFEFEIRIDKTDFNFEHIDYLSFKITVE